MPILETNSNMQVENCNIMADLAVQRCVKTNDSITIIVTGLTGSGKSWVMLYLARMIAKKIGTDYSVENNVFFDQETLAMKMAKENRPSGTVWCLEEMQTHTNSRKSMSNANVDWTEVMSVIRCLNYVIIMTVPDARYVDVRVRDRVDYEIQCKKECINRKTGMNATMPSAVFKTGAVQKPFANRKIYVLVDDVQRPFTTLVVPKPTKEDIDFYEKMKKDFVMARLNSFNDRKTGADKTKSYVESDRYKKGNEIFNAPKPLTERQQMVVDAYKKNKKHVKNTALALNTTVGNVASHLKAIVKKGHIVI